jgi:hypothetical protein
VLRYEVLPGLPTEGSTAVPFGSGWAGAWSGHSEGLIVRFHPNSNAHWVGNFQPGSGGWEGVLDHPDGTHVIALARGQGYVIEPAIRELVCIVPSSIQYAVDLPHLHAIVFSDGLGFEAIRSDGVWWTSPRISWDEVRVLKIEGTILRGEASSPVANSWVPFTLDLLTGQCDDGVYARDMRKAIPVRRPSADGS